MISLTRPTQATGIASMLGSNLFFSLMAILVRVDPHLSGIEAAFYRFAIGALFIVTVALFGAVHLRFKDLRGLLWRGVVGGISVALYLLPINEIGLGKSSLFQYTYPFYAIVFSAIFLKEKITWGIVGLLTVAMGGLVLVELPSLGSGQWSPWVLSAWASGVLSGLAVMYVKKLSATESSSSIFLSQCIGGFWITLVPAHMVASPLGWGTGLLLLAIGLSAAVGQLLMTWSYKHVDVSTGSLLGTLVPVVNVVAGILLFGESFSLLEIVGAVVTLSACFLLVLVKMRPRSPLPHSLR
jgi:drug/metabolite transporter (DMT)-like permease